MRAKTLQGAELLLFTAAAVSVFVFRDFVSEGFSNALTVSVASLIPSLFPMMILSGLFSRSAACSLGERIFSPLTRYAFRMTPRCFSPIFCGLFFGYPVGGALCAEFLKSGKIDRKTAERLMLFTMNPGIGFLLFFIPKVTGSFAIGLSLFISLSLASVLLGILSGIGIKVPKKSQLLYEKAKALQVIKSSAESSGKSCCTMVLYMLLFSSLCSVIQGILIKLFPGISRDIISVLFGINEVTLGLNCWLSGKLPGWVLLLFLSFGGLCVQLQIFSFFHEKVISFGKFYLGRLIHFLLSLGIYMIISRLYIHELQVFSCLGADISHEIRGNLICSMLMALLLPAFTVCIGKDMAKSHSL